jgi:hypothetical protein
MGVLRQILSIKEFRESRAEQAYVRQRGVHQRATQAMRDREDELAAFREESRRREEELFGGVMGRAVRLSEIQDLNLVVEDLRLQDRRHVAKVEEARATETQARETLAVSRQTHTQAMQVRERFSEIVDSDDKEATQEAERREDNELGEVAEIRNSRSRPLHDEEPSP